MSMMTPGINGHDDEDEPPMNRMRFNFEEVSKSGYTKLSDPYVDLYVNGKAVVAQITDLTWQLFKSKPKPYTASAAEIKQASANRDNDAADKAVKHIAVESTKASYAEQCRVARYIIATVTPWLERSNEWQAEQEEETKHKPKQKVIRKAKPLSDWAVFPTLRTAFACLFFLAVIGLGFYAESITAMTYLTVTRLDFLLSLQEVMPETSPWVTAWAMSFAYVIGPMVLLKTVPTTMLLKGNIERFWGRFRFFAVVLVIAAPVIFGWVLGVEEMHSAIAVGGEIAEMPPTPGMIGYIIVEMFLISLATTVSAHELGKHFDEFMVTEVVWPEDTVLAEKERMNAIACVSSLAAVVQCAEDVLAEAEAAAKAAALSASVSLVESQQDRSARSAQAFLMRN